VAASAAVGRLAGGDPSVSWSTGSTVYYATLGFQNNASPPTAGACSNGGLYIYRSTDGGATWGTRKSTANNATVIGGQPLVQPGGTVIGEKVRAILMDAAHDELDPVAEWLLIEAARGQHVADVIVPALREGVFLLCDRFRDSTEAYQAAGRGLDAGMVAELDERVRGGLEPDLSDLEDIGRGDNASSLGFVEELAELDVPSDDGDHSDE